MLAGRVYRIFQYYASETVRLERTGPTLTGPDGAAVGAVERVAVEAGRLVAEGWAEVPSLVLRQGAAESRAMPAGPPGGRPRFRLDLPFAPGMAEIVALGPDGARSHAVRGFTAAELLRARRARALPFAVTLMRLAPVVWRWKLGGDLGAREEVKEVLRLVPRSAAGRLDPAVLAPASDPLPPGPFTIVMPVHNGLALTRRALDRVAAHSAPGWHLVVVEDASTEPGLRAWLTEWAAARPDRVTLILNAENKGFVGAANLGIDVVRARAPDAPVVLLNSDALVPEGWAERLLAPLRDAGVASATPLSNDAEILSVPVICARDDLRAGEAEVLDRAAARLNGAAAQVPMPTGVGFCMAMAPQFLARLPCFDTAFGRGYGEEVDWCRRAMALGGRHVAVVDLFVEHRGGASFGSAEKQRLLQRNAGLISRRHPEYDAEVRSFVATDPLVTARLAVGLELAAVRAADAVPVWLAHAMGGGAENDLQRRLAALCARGQAGVVLRVGQGRLWTVELHGAHGVTTARTDDFATVAFLIARLPHRRIIYSCGVGDPDPTALPDRLLALSGRGAWALPGTAQPIEILLHDYFPISPSYTLLGADGVYHGVPRPGTDAGVDPAHVWHGRSGTETSLAQWQAGWGRLMETAERIELFSEASRALLSEAYPRAVPSMVTCPHRLPAPPPRLLPGRGAGGRPVIGVLGNIGAHKGAAVLQQLARVLAGSGAARLVVIGRLAPEYTLAAPSAVHGRYRIEDLPGLVARYGICAWFIPSVWPETFSFATHEALATGLPVAAFDLGAQGAAVREAENGTALPCPGQEGLVPETLLAALRGVRA